MILNRYKIVWIFLFCSSLYWSSWCNPQPCRHLLPTFAVIVEQKTRSGLEMLLDVVNVDIEFCTRRGQRELCSMKLVNAECLPCIRPSPAISDGCVETAVREYNCIKMCSNQWRILKLLTHNGLLRYTGLKQSHAKLRFEWVYWMRLLFHQWWFYFALCLNIEIVAMSVVLQYVFMTKVQGLATATSTVTRMKFLWM